MSKNGNNKKINETLIKFFAPKNLKVDLQELANARNITLSSLLRLITTDYIRRNQQA
jgi:hypothetical protein